jgi:hypothetical protein
LEARRRANRSFGAQNKNPKTTMAKKSAKAAKKSAPKKKTAAKKKK